MIFELRIYRAIPGKLKSMVDRFGSVTLPIWERHGIRHVGFWTTLIGPSSQELYYMLAWDSLAERETKWAAFMADPEWVTKLKASEVDGPMVENIETMFLNPTDYSVTALQLGAPKK
jgi:hypothetical protein